MFPQRSCSTSSYALQSLTSEAQTSMTVFREVRHGVACVVCRQRQVVWQDRLLGLLAERADGARHEGLLQSGRQDDCSEPAGCCIGGVPHGQCGLTRRQYRWCSTRCRTRALCAPDGTVAVTTGRRRSCDGGGEAAAMLRKGPTCTSSR